MRLLDRLAGLETEYAIRFRADADQPAPDGASAPARPAPRLSNFQLYDAVVAELKRLMPVARAKHSKRGFFLANGGAVWLEKGGQGVNAGLVEGATPECRGPRRLVAQQRAQDALLAAAARDVSAGGEFALCKSDCDAWGQAYGAQENYEFPVAAGWRWRAWRVGLLLLTPAAVLTWVPLAALCLVVLAWFPVGVVLFLVVLGVCLLLRKAGLDVSPRAARVLLLGRDTFTDANVDARGDVFPDWLEWAASRVMQLCILPLGAGVLALVHLTAFRDVRRQLLPMLLSRCVIGGSGRLTRDGKHHVASKAARLTRVVGLNGFPMLGDQPVFGFGYLLRAVLHFTVFSARGGSPLVARRQRLQICLGDSNLCEEAEYLRVGTTMLVLDAIEAGELPPPPRFRRPRRALRVLAADPALCAAVKSSDGRRWTALELQRFYLKACQDFVARRPDAPPEALDLLRRWEDVLDRLETDPGSLVGRLDWVTKRFLLEQCGAGADWDVRKKIDLRYHELSPDGYLERLRSAGVVPGLLTEQEVELAKLDPPADTRAAARARLIRELAEDQTLRVNWDTVTVGKPGSAGARTIELVADFTDPHRDGATAAAIK